MNAKEDSYASLSNNKNIQKEKPNARGINDALEVDLNLDTITGPVFSINQGEERKLDDMNSN